MIINIVPYTTAEKLILDEIQPNNWISIRDIGYDHLYTNMDIFGKNILKLEFDDITYYDEKHNLLHPFYEKEKEKRQLVHFSISQAVEILKFAEQVYNKGEVLNIHCWAGKSRSQAIGYTLNIYFNLFKENNQKDFTINVLKFNDMFKANPDVIRTMNMCLFPATELNKGNNNE